MHRRARLLVVLASICLGCPTEEGETGGDTETDTDMPTTTSPSTTTPSTTTPSTSATTMTTEPPTSTTVDPTTGDPTDTDTDPTLTGGMTTTTGGGEVTYPPCEAPGGTTGGTTTTGGFSECPPEYNACYEFPFGGGNPTHNKCTILCDSPDECIEPSSGNAPVDCAGPPGSETCVLDCTPGAGGGTTTTGGEITCPDGMVCVDIGFMGFSRCLWEL